MEKRGGKVVGEKKGRIVRLGDRKGIQLRKPLQLLEGEANINRKVEKKEFKRGGLGGSILIKIIYLGGEKNCRNSHFQWGVKKWRLVTWEV